MKKKCNLLKGFIFFSLDILLFIPSWGSEQDFYTLLPSKTVDAIIAHVSGEMAHQHIREISQHHRYAASQGYLGAAEYVLSMAKKYGLREAQIETYPADGKALYYMWKSFEGWDGEFGELWLVEPHKERIVSFADTPVCLCRNSQSADVTAELIDVRRGTSAEDYEAKNVQGKVVLASGEAGDVHKEAVFKRGALGVVSYWAYRPVDYPDLVTAGGISPYESGDGKRATFGFTISYKKGEELRRMLEAGHKLVVEAKVKAVLRPNSYYVVTAIIPGTDPAAEEFLMVAHLCHHNPGSNDNASGSASLLEIARTVQRLISGGEIKPPRRTLRFLWVPEMSGSYAYSASNPEIIEKMICGINMDGVGSYLSRNNSGYYFHCTPHSLPHFINDVVANFADFVGTTNNEEDYYSDFKFSKPIISESGSRDGFRYKIAPFMGGSDHKIFNDKLINVPMVFFSIWPDVYYHTNQDTPDKCDPTTLRRGAFIAAASAVFVSSASADEAFALASQSYSRGLARTSQDMKKGFDHLNKSEATELASAYRRAVNWGHHAHLREKKILESILALDPRNASLKNYLANFNNRLEIRENEFSQDIFNHYSGLCAKNGIEPVEIKMSYEERAAQKIIPVRDPELKGPLGGGYLLGKLGVSSLAEIAPFLRDERIAYEVFNFIDGKSSLLEIRDAVSAEYEPLSLREIREFYEALVRAGIVTLRQ